MSKNPESTEYQLTDADFDAAAEEISRRVARIEDSPTGRAFATGMLKAAVLFEHRLRKRGAVDEDPCTDHGDRWPDCDECGSGGGGLCPVCKNQAERHTR
ncbi:hypothetical protein C5B90_19315 [Haloferax sp. Atlit-12N]|uniref:hypothetical protein n=1 Tax=unclassified Haloferax TaxID=2625095 RepID=UPI000E2706D1|nr:MULTISPECIES: hypothetical protein [unclassified Haloferax]RDZ61422.1 hypothetical protein C5B90_19315 [Haloferax sp. Atlit-12N]REA00234.1 hypothetical protein DEQ92_20500 [Haloferax sp. Atlit-6N]